jgi:hypothetical protein
LSLGTRKDATTWENVCRDLGFDLAGAVKKPYPTLDELKTLFRTKPHWLFIAGHFGDMKLLNEKEDVWVDFDTDKVTLSVKRDTAQLDKTSGSFAWHSNCEVVLWGGCDVCTSKDTMGVLRKLFGEHVLLGFRGLTGWKMVDAMLGGGFIKRDHFFDRVRGHEDDPVAIRDAWMKTAQHGYGGGDLESRFRAVDRNGQEWLLKEKKIVRGRKIG